MDTTQQQDNVTLRIALAWAFVGIPLAWGVWQTLTSAMNLFY